MKAALWRKGGAFEVVEVPTPRPGPGEVLVKVAYCGICGSDLHLVDTGMLPDGSVIGHELSGWVAEPGPGVAGFKEGDPVAVLPGDPCLECEPCRQGQVQVCEEGLARSYGLGRRPGGFSEFMLVKAGMCHPVPAGMDLKTAALTEPFAVAWHGVAMSRVQPGELVLVMGAGPIGLFCVYALRAIGASRVYVSEPDPSRAGKAKAAGAILAIDPKAERPGVVIQRHAGRLPHVVIDCAGTQNSLQEALFTVGPRGRVLALGIFMGKLSYNPFPGFAKEVQVNFSFGYTGEEFEAALLLLAAGAAAPEVLVSEVLPLAELGRAFQLLHEPGREKILIDCQKT